MKGNHLKQNSKQTLKTKDVLLEEGWLVGWLVGHEVYVYQISVKKVLP